MEPWNQSKFPICLAQNQRTLEWLCEELLTLVTSVPRAEPTRKACDCPEVPNQRESGCWISSPGLPPPAAVSREIRGQILCFSHRQISCLSFSAVSSRPPWKSWFSDSTPDCLFWPFSGFSGRVFKYLHDCLRWLIPACFPLDSSPRPR